jgi:hypothetical protein
MNQTSFVAWTRNVSSSSFGSPAIARNNTRTYVEAVTSLANNNIMWPYHHVWVCVFIAATRHVAFGICAEERGRQQCFLEHPSTDDHSYL